MQRRLHLHFSGWTAGEALFNVFAVHSLYGVFKSVFFLPVSSIRTSISPPLMYLCNPGWKPHGVCRTSCCFLLFRGVSSLAVVLPALCSQRLCLCDRRVLFPLTILTRINMLEVIRLPISPSAIARLKAQGLREAWAPSALFSGGGSVCLQQLNQSLKVSVVMMIYWCFMCCAPLIRQVKKQSVQAEGQYSFSNINESVQKPNLVMLSGFFSCRMWIWK